MAMVPNYSQDTTQIGASGQSVTPVARRISGSGRLSLFLGIVRTSYAMSVSIAKTDADIRDCWLVMAQLRPHLKERDFISVVRGQLEGYRLAYIRRKKKIAAVAGFRMLHSLAWGHFCYVDDLVTDEQTRSQGLGKELLDWLCKFARSEGCKRLELDSGVQRFAAHRFYLRHSMFISCHHFSLEL